MEAEARKWARLGLAFFFFLRFVDDMDEFERGKRETKWR